MRLQSAALGPWSSLDHDPHLGDLAQNRRWPQGINASLGRVGHAIRAAIPGNASHEMITEV